MNEEVTGYRGMLEGESVVVRKCVFYGRALPAGYFDSKEQALADLGGRLLRKRDEANEAAIVASAAFHRASSDIKAGKYSVEKIIRKQWA